VFDHAGATEIGRGATNVSPAGWAYANEGLFLVEIEDVKRVNPYLTRQTGR